MPSFPLTIEQIIGAIILSSAIALVALARKWILKKIEFFNIRRKVKPKLAEVYKTYCDEITPIYVETKPRLTVSDKKPAEGPFGTIFVTPEEVPVIDNTFIISLPPACSLRQIRVLFDTNLRRALFDYLAWRLALKLKRENFATKIYDRAMEKYKEEFSIVSKLHEERKLTEVVLQEALRRIRKYTTLADISPDDINEFSLIVRDWAKRDFGLTTIGDEKLETYTEYIIRDLKRHKEALVLALGAKITKAIDVTEMCKRKVKGIETKIEIDSWFFPTEKRTVSAIRIWLKRKRRERRRKV